MSTEIATVKTDLNPAQASRDFLIAILFPKSSSKSFPIALRFAKQATLFKEGSIEGKPCFLVGIKNDPVDVSLAMDVLSCVHGWKGTLVFIAGRQHGSPYKVFATLRCLLEASECNDSRAHCQVIGDHPIVGAMRSMAAGSLTTLSNEEVKKTGLPPKILYPCRLIQPYFDVIQHGHPSSIPDQIQAIAVRHGCHWCPLFDARKVEILENGV